MARIPLPAHECDGWRIDIGPAEGDFPAYLPLTAIVVRELRTALAYVFAPWLAPPVDERPILYVHTDHNADEVRSFYELPDEIARRVQPAGEPRTFARCLADLVDGGTA